MIEEWAEAVRWYSENPDAMGRLDPVLKALVESVIAQAAAQNPTGQLN